MKHCPQKISAFFLAWLSVLFLVLPVGASGETESMPVFATASAQSYVLMDADTGEVLSSSQKDMPLPMASTTKIMTALLAVESGRLGDLVTVPRDAVGTEGSSVYLIAGEKILLSDLVYALLLESANDAAVTIAYHLSGDIPTFCEAMNAKAKDLGMAHTHFVNPHGLPAEGHVASATDLANLMRNALKNEAFSEICSTKQKTIPAPEGKTRYLSNHNRLLKTYPSCIAGKTGYTKSAGRCLVTAARQNGKTLVCATLSDPHDWQDHKALFEYGFSLYSKAFNVSTGEISGTIPVVGGTTDSLSFSNRASLSFPLKEGQTAHVIVETESFLFAPQQRDSAIGSAKVTVDGVEVSTIPLFLDAEVDFATPPPTFFQKLWNKIKNWLHL